MRKWVVVLVLIGISWFGFDSRSLPDVQRAPPERPRSESPREERVPDALGQAADRTKVSGAGTVVKVLSDDNDGSRHQRFLLRLRSGQTLMVAHNIDLAARVAPLAAGDQIAFSGEYIWNPKGGTLHWTHRDPAGRHAGGWLQRDGHRFQ